MNESLETLLADGIIEAVIGQLKTGKEAEVWLVQHAGEVVAAKLYKERHERNFRNNVGYREGREVRNSRTRRAMEKGSRFGQAAAEDAWKSAESDSLYKLHAQGVRVPTPVLFYEGILLMELVLDAEGHPAPRLVEAPPATPEAAQALYLDLRAQVVNMLCADLIHGDLSPYNILMSWQGATIIDFPQTVAAARNNRAEFYFRRDLDNVRNFLAGISPALGGMEGDTGEIWNAYVRRELTPDFVPKGGFRDGPRRGGGKGPREGRAGGVREERRRDFRPEPVAAEVAPPAPPSNLSPEEAAEAELRELEALVLKQGGGERGKPAVAPPQRGGRNRSFGGGRPPPRAGGNRPPAMGGAPRPPQGEQRGGNGPRPPQGEQRGGSGPRPPQGEQRGGNGAPPPGGQRMGGPRGGGNGRPAQGEPRGPGGNRRPIQGEPRGPNNLAGPAQGASAPSEPRGQNTPGPRSNGRPPRNEQRGGGGGFEQRARDNNRGEPRGWSEQPRGGNPSRPPRNERRGGAPVVETRPAMGAPAAGTPGEQRPGGPGNGGGPRQQRPAQNRGGSWPQRSGSPQVSFVSRPAQSSDPGSHETGS